MFIGRSYTRIVILVQIGNPTWLPGPIMCSSLKLHTDSLSIHIRRMLSKKTSKASFAPSRIINMYQEILSFFYYSFLQETCAGYEPKKIKKRHILCNNGKISVTCLKL
jgi:hypothetical protein